MPEFFKAKTGIAAPFFNANLTALKDRALQVIYGPRKQFSGGEANIPVGLIVGFEGLIADIPKGWAFCDGNNGTPDLTDHMIIGADLTYSYNSTGGQNSESVVITSTSTGNHTGAANLNGSPGAGTYYNASKGAHTHDITCPIDNRPATRSVVFIMATNVLAQFPINAVLHFNNSAENTSNNFVEDTNFQARCLNGVNDDTRANTTDNSENVSITTTTSGNHQHNNGSPGGGLPGGSGSSYPTTSSGNHNHDQALSITKDLPPYHALTTLKAIALATPMAKLVAYFYGDLGNLPSTWLEANGSNGTLDLRGKFVIGQDEGITYSLNDTGGSSSRNASGSLPSKSVSHSHSSGSRLSGIGMHPTASPAHIHGAFSGAMEMPKYRALYIVIYQ